MRGEQDSSSVSGQLVPPDGALSPPTIINWSNSSTTLDDFEIVREIGRGGTAIVYEARQKSLRRSVALKQLPAAAALDQRWLDRFRNEVRAAAKLHHANIVPFFELGRDQDLPFYTMQLVDGISLAEVINRLRQCRASVDGASRPCMNLETDPVHPAFRKLCDRCRCRIACRDATTPQDTAEDAEAANERPDLVASLGYHRAVAELIRDAALAVDYAHNQGILHLDLKPSNLLVDGQGKLWITDFGASRPNSGGGSSGLKRVTGTLCYMSPEQTLGQDEQLDRRSDMYSLGATLYELLTLDRPFPHASRHDLLPQVALERFKSARHVNHVIPPELGAIVAKAMAGQPAKRYATGRELAEVLDRYLSAADHSANQSVRPSYRKRVLTLVVCPAVLLVLAALSAIWLRKDAPHPVYQWNGHFYALTSKESDWVTAEAEAVTQGGHLITIGSRQEQEFVVATFLSPPDKVFWIGLTDAPREGDWHWVSGEPVEYTTWAVGEPNNMKWSHPVTGEVFDEDYGVINWHSYLEPPGSRRCTWSDIDSLKGDNSTGRFRGIMEFATDPRR